MAREKAMVTADEKGQPVRMVQGQYFDNAKPQADEGGKVPQFVNATTKVQKITVPNNPGGTITVPRFGILYGAQWREVYATPGKKWGLRTPFIERVRNADGEYDGRYLLTAKQMVEEIQALSKRPGNQKRIRALVDNAVFGVDEKGRASPDGLRTRDDRIEVLKVENEVIRRLDALQMERDRKAGRTSRVG